MKKVIVMASGNIGKIEEAKEILNDYEIVSIKDKGINIDIKEEGKTFVENAIKKSEVIAQELNGELCLADDSGIEIDYLNGFPGVKTRRWLPGTDRDRNLALIEKMKNVPKEKRRIVFTTALAISNGNDTIHVTGKIEGYVAEAVRGNNGFGFDEIFELKNGKTLAELTQEEKNEISARRIALDKLKQKMI